jgi:hypothetical protein
MFSSRWYVWNDYGSITGISSSVILGFCESIILVNGKIQYFVKEKRVKPSDYYRLRSEIVSK